MKLQNCSDTTVKLQWNYSETTVKLQWNYSETTVKLQWSYKESETIRKLQETYKKLLKITRN